MKKYLASLAVLVMILGVMPTDAQYQTSPPPGPPNQASNQPAELQPGVARVSFIHGDVSSQRGDNGDWVAVTLNSPIANDDRVSTGEKSRAELQLDYADILRMSDRATAKVVNLSRTHIQLQIGQGLASYSVFKGSEADTEIDTPNASIHPQGPGEYRILVNSDAETQVTVRNGTAEVSTSQGSTRLEKGQMITVAGTDNPQYKTDSASGKDDWDSWNDDRNHRIGSAESWRKTNRYFTGSEDLDTYGTWSEVPDYGPVWAPAAGPGWAPYRDGRWVWEPYYGWTWVSYEPWGWAPYHYGRWFVYGGNWVWWPGPVVAYPSYYPVWSPAYVSFFGFGRGGFGFGFGFGNVGWVPIGPFDPFFPWFGSFGFRSNFFAFRDFDRFRDRDFGRDRFRDRDFDRFRDRFRAGDRDRFSNINRMFKDPRTRSGISSMSSREFGQARVSMRQSPMNEAALRQASMVTGKMPIAPSRGSFNPSGRAASPSTIRNAPSRFFSPSRTNIGGSGQAPRSFGNTPARGQSAVGGNRNGGSFGAPSSHAMTANRANTPGSSQPSPRPGWRTFTPPSSGSMSQPARGSEANNHAAANNATRGAFTSPAARQGQPSPAEGRNGWQHFAPPAHESQPQSTSRGFSPNASRQFEPPASRDAYQGRPNSSYSRPPLNMRQPVMTPRGGSGNSAPRGSTSAPQGGSSRGGSGGGSRGSTGGGSRGGTGGSSRGGTGGSSRGGGDGHSGGGRSL